MGRDAARVPAAPPGDVAGVIECSRPALPRFRCAFVCSFSHELGEMRTAELLALLRGIVARLTLVGCRPALVGLVVGAGRPSGHGLMDLLREQSRRWVAT